MSEHIYKVVRVYSSGMLSATIEGSAAKHYSIGYWTKAWPGSLGIFCFDNLGAARRWASCFRPWRVIACEWRGRRVHRRLRLDSNNVSRRMAMNAKKHLRNWLLTRYTPLGTVTVDAVKPIKFI